MERSRPLRLSVSAPVRDPDGDQPVGNCAYVAMQGLCSRHHPRDIARVRWIGQTDVGRPASIGTLGWLQGLQHARRHRRFLKRARAGRRSICLGLADPPEFVLDALHSLQSRTLGIREPCLLYGRVVERPFRFLSSVT